MGFLYINSKGKEVVRHSYSAGVDFHNCPYRYYLRRLVGCKEKDSKAALLFGRALEDAVQYHHEHKGEGGIEQFEKLWAPHQAKEGLIYTKTEKTWLNLYQAGKDMMRLYTIRLPELPIPMDTRFQREFVKEVFPEDPRLGGIEFYGKLDMISYVDPRHPLLPQIYWEPKMGLVRPLIIDMKTSGVKWDGQVQDDQQLRTYAWLAGIFDVAFLWFKKSGSELKKGSIVSMLETSGPLIAGTEAIVAYIADDDSLMLVADEEQLEEMNKAQGRKENGNLETTKAATERKMNWLAQNAEHVLESTVTRQRLQFSAGRVDPQKAATAGQIAGKQIVEIVNARESGEWHDTFGQRYPHDDRKDSYYRAFVQGDNVFRDATFEHSIDDYDSDDEIDVQFEQEEA
jgi:hypothetical protein